MYSSERWRRGRARSWALGPDQLACGDVQPLVAAAAGRALEGDDVPVANGHVDEVRSEASSGAVRAWAKKSSRMAPPRCSPAIGLPRKDPDGFRVEARACSLRSRLASRERLPLLGDRGGPASFGRFGNRAVSRRVPRTAPRRRRSARRQRRSACVERSGRRCAPASTQTGPTLGTTKLPRRCAGLRAATGLTAACAVREAQRS